MNTSTELTSQQRGALLVALKTRFETHPPRHAGITWEQALARLEAHPDKLWSLAEMERTGGEPDVVAVDAQTGEVIFYDCAPETPAGRRNLCYDRAALDARKEHKPADSAMDMAAAMGVVMLTEEQYRTLQTLGEFDLKTSSWVGTPPEVRKLSGALFCDRRFGRVFTYHNGADSYYGSRGFRASLRV
jgi:hypothetical protein